MRERFADFSRRQTLKGLAGASALALLPACARSQAAPATNPASGSITVRGRARSSASLRLLRRPLLLC